MDSDGLTSWDGLQCENAEKTVVSTESSRRRRGGRAADCTGLENRRRRKVFASSNLAPSAKRVIRYFRPLEAILSSSHFTAQVPMDAEPRSRRCLRCGGEKLEPGSLAGRGGLGFYPANSTFWTLSPSVEVQAFLCLDCGSLELIGDVKKAESLVGRSNSEE